MDTVSVLIKPASGRCNLRCRYCFYEDVSGLRSEQDLGLMTEETLEELVVYRALYGDGGLWVRPASMWTELIDRDGYHGPRFTWVAER